MMVVGVNLVLTVKLGGTKCISFIKDLTRWSWINFVRKREILSGVFRVKKKEKEMKWGQGFLGILFHQRH